MSGIEIKVCMPVMMISSINRLQIGVHVCFPAFRFIVFEITRVCWSQEVNDPGHRKQKMWTRLKLWDAKSLVVDKTGFKDF